MKIGSFRCLTLFEGPSTQIQAKKIAFLKNLKAWIMLDYRMFLAGNVVAVTMKNGPNNAICVVWAISKFFLSFFY